MFIAFFLMWFPFALDSLDVFFVPFECLDSPRSKLIEFPASHAG